MRIKAKFVLDRAGFRNQVLLDNGDANLIEMIKPAVEAVAPPGTDVIVSKVTSAKGRFRIRIVDERDNADHNESVNGELTRALNRLRV